MGMFDTVVVEGLKLPTNRDINSFLKQYHGSLPHEYQTKDLDNVLSTYHINSSGQIFHEERISTGRKVPYTNLFSNWADNRSFLEKTYFKAKGWLHDLRQNNNDCLREIDEYKTVKKKSKLNSDFSMLAYENIGGRYLSLDYGITAVNGVVKKIKLLTWDIESEQEATDRINRDKEFYKKLTLDSEKRKKFASAWYYPIIKQTWNPFVFFAGLIVRSICNKLVSWSYKWHGV